MNFLTWLDLIYQEQVWQDEKKVGNCQQCEQAFSVARRKVKSYFIKDPLNFDHCL